MEKNHEEKIDREIEKRILGEYNSWYNLFTNFRKVCDKTETYWVNKYMPNPAPDAYTPKIRVNTDGTFISSKIHNIKSAHFGLDKSDRWRSYKRKLFLF